MNLPHRSAAAALLFLVAATGGAAAVGPESRPASATADRPVGPAASAPTPLTPAGRAVAQAEAAVRKAPGHPPAHAALAVAFARRARETSDTEYYDKAQAALDQAFALAPTDPDAARAQIWVMLGRHEFPKALALAKALNKRMPDDPLTYAFMADAHLELGDYEAAEAAVQFMFDLRPGTVPGLTRGAYFRELTGDVDGAVEFMEQAFQRTPPAESEDRAWILTHLAHLHLSGGRLERARPLLDQAFALFPDYHYALSNLARLRAAEGKHAEAADVLKKHVAAAPHPENLFYYAEALALAGRAGEAKAAFADFERQARAEMETLDNANRELVYYYADHAGRPDEAVRVARWELGWRKDTHTRAALAWALYRSGAFAEAAKEVEAAMAAGIRDARTFYQAGQIRRKLGEAAEAAVLLRRSLEVNPTSEVAAAARAALAELQPAGGAAGR